MNPFNFGAVATGRWFVDREKELAQLKREMQSAGKVLLISPRRYGKTSLAYQLMKELHGNHCIVPVYIDTLTCTTLHQFANKYSEALTKAIESKAERILSFFKEVLPSLRPQIQVSPEGEVSLEVAVRSSLKEEIATFERVLELPERAAVRRKKKIVVIFDEFQAIQDLGGAHDQLLWKIRSAIQHHRHVGYLFAGSQKHLLEQMVLPKDSPFFRMATPLRLGKIPIPSFLPFIQRLFRESGIKIQSPVLQQILERTENIPYYVLNLCHEIYEYAQEHQKTADARTVEACVTLLVQRNQPQYEREWETLSILQRNVLRAIAGGQQRLHSSQVTKDFELTSIGGVQKALKSLIEGQFLTREQDIHAFEDIWFKEWVRRSR